MDTKQNNTQKGATKAPVVNKTTTDDKSHKVPIGAVVKTTK